MARNPRNIEIEDEGSGYSVLGRHLLWAGVAAVALGIAVLAAQSQSGTQRLAGISSRDSGSAPAPRPPAPQQRQAEPAARQAEPDAETRRLAETVRQLAADRDRLLARIDALERSLDVTGSVPRENAAPRDSAARDNAAPTAPGTTPALPPGWSLVPNTIPPAAGMPGAAAPKPSTGLATPQAPATPPGSAATSGMSGSEQATGSVATKTEFAVDLGGDATFDGLRALWTSARTSQPALFEGLRPVVAVREGGKSGALELRLVVGPLSNAGAAARLCASLVAAGLACQPTVFDGQRFALR